MFFSTILVLALAATATARFVRINDGSFKMITCSGGGRISITSALYGRSDVSSCQQQDVYKKMRKNCNAASTCFVSANAAFLGVTDICKNTSKYLDIQYDCAEPIQKVLSCNGTQKFRCSPGYVIKVSRAYWGRESIYTCRHKWRYTQTGCSLSNTLSRVQAQCEGKRYCKVNARRFGSPCIGPEYFEATYQCVERGPATTIAPTTTPSPHHKDQICQNENAIISCPAGSLLNITRAVFGRTDTTSCIAPNNGGNTNTKCIGNVLAYYQQRCQYKQVCVTFATTAILGDPCPGTSKYLDLEYTCEKQVITPSTAPPITTKPPYDTKILCEGMSTLLRCFGGVLNIINATFGRQNGHTCSSSAGGRLNTDCVTSVTKDIKFFCQGKWLCVIFANPGQYGDPCPGTSKYLKVDYKCQEKGTYQPPTRPSVPSVPTAPTLPPTQPPTYPPTPTDPTTQPPPDPFTNVMSETTVVGTSALPKVTGTTTTSTTESTTDTPTVITHDFFGTSTTTETPSTTTEEIITAPPQVCGTPVVQQSRVINGVDAKAGAWPWQIALYSSTGDFMCGGTLLNPFWIVTAAHCVNRDPTPSSYYIVLGDTDRKKIEGHELKFGLAKIIIHEDYDQVFGIRHDNDIAMIKLDRPALFNNYISPACLPGRYFATKNCFVTGWGKIVYPGYSHTMLQQANIKLVTRQECQDKLKTAPGSPGDAITTNMVCGNGNNGESGCQGDSGGPFVCQDNNGKWVLRGIVSWGSARCNIGDMYSVFVDVSRYVNWIHRAMFYN